MFETLFIHWHVDPVILHLGAFELRYYSLLFVGGFILGWYLLRDMYRNEGISEDLVDNLLYTLLIATIVGARLGHCLFYQPDYYLGSWEGFLEIFQPWKGGLASHGGAIAILLAMWWFVHHYGPRYKFDYLWLLDRLCIVVAFAGCMIRVGNLFNSEIYGDVTSLPWGVIFDLRKETEPKHPTQIYEALSYLVLGLVMLWIYWKKLDKVHRGFFFGIFFVGCFGMRFLIEFIKEPQVDFEEGMLSQIGLNMGQMLSIPFILAGIGLLVYAAVTRHPSRLQAAQPSRK